MMKSENHKSLVDLLQKRAAEQPDRLAFNFLLDGESLEAKVSYSELDARARAIGAVLQKKGLTGKTVVLLYAPGPEYIAGFFGCLYGGAIAVPAYPPNPSQIRLTIKKLQGVMKDAGCAAVLATSDLVRKLRPLFLLNPSMWKLKWIPTDQIDTSAGDRWKDTNLTRDHIAFLQYTSGSTGDPKGVMLSHGNLLCNLESIQKVCGYNPDSRGVSWLPPYHDMGLIGGILCPIYSGFPITLMSPIDFLTKPLRWLQAISKYKATASVAPNFGYALCVRKISAEDRAKLDLSSWRIAKNGAEPIRQEVLESFYQTFKEQGFKKEAFFPCYGLAESTLFVTGPAPGRGSFSVLVDATSLEQNKVTLLDEKEASNANSRRLVGCGVSAPHQKMAIVNPDTCVECEEGTIGEIWISSGSVAKGYWKQPERSEKTFRARIVGKESFGAFLRTGDLGFMTRDGELYVTGRLKDLVIIRGRNHYPQDIERTVEQATHSVRPGCSAAFAVDVNGEEKLVVVSEVERRFTVSAKRNIPGEGLKGEPEKLKPLDSEAVFQAIRRAVAHNHEIQLHEMVLVRAGSIPKTSSGKIRRSTTKQEYLAKKLATIATDSLGNGGTRSRAPEEKTVDQSLERETPRVIHENHPGIEKELRAKLSTTLGIPVDNLDVSQSMSSIGMDSLSLVEFGTFIQSRYGIDLSFEKFFGDTSISALANELACLGAIPGGGNNSAKPVGKIASPIPLRTMFEYERLSAGETWQRALVFLYVPFGISLVLARISALAVWIPLFFPFALLSRRLTQLYFKGICVLAGMFVFVHNRDAFNPYSGPRVVVANHPFTLDGAAWMSVSPSALVVAEKLAQNRFYRLFSRIARFVVVQQKNTLPKLYDAVNSSDRPVVCFPEGCTTNGIAGVLRYHPFLFSLGVPVHPVSIRLRRPMPLVHSLLWNNYYADLFWQLFVPWTIFDMTLLPPESKRPEESAQEFADRVQRLTARSVGLVPVGYDADDKTRLRNKTKSKRKGIARVASVYRIGWTEGPAIKDSGKDSKKKAA